MNWLVSHRADPDAVALADRHYNRQKPGSPQFVPPGRCFVLLSECRRAVWVTSWPFAEYAKHAWAGAWVNSIFRNEGAGLSSALIRSAVAATRAHWSPPTLGIVTFVDAAKVRSTNPGCCYKHAGWQRAGTTKGGLIAWQQLPEQMPEPVPAVRSQRDLFTNASATP